MHRSLLIVFFFFQAEDGIRDYKVTGVQTCALPISPRLRPASVASQHFLDGAATPPNLGGELLSPATPGNSQHSHASWSEAKPRWCPESEIRLQIRCARIVLELRQYGINGQGAAPVDGAI